VRTATIICGAVLAALSSAAQGAGGFVFEVAEPRFRVTIPDIPQMKMDDHPMAAAQPHLRFFGSEGPYTVSILTPTADAGMSALECASSTVRSLSLRMGGPQPSQVRRARINDTTFIALYAMPVVGAIQLHAHILSASRGTHCIEVHASMISTSKDDLTPWFKGFGKASIEPN